MIFFCVALFVLGHLIRDGWPATGSTHLARALAGICCIIGSLVAQQPWYFGAMIWIGFYIDMKHGEGQGAATAQDASFLVISGLTSLLPLALLIDHTYIMLIGVAKIPIWFFWWWMEKRFVMTNWWGWLFPTRLAAMTFGAVVGVLVSSL